MITIILLKFNNREYEDECFHSIIDFTDIPYHLLVQDNFPDKIGVAEGWNKAIAKTDSEYICLLNTDTIVEKGWLEKLTNVLDNDKKLGAVGPITNKCGTPQSGFKKSHKADVIVPAQTLSGFCLVFRRKLWEEQPFNEDYRIYAEETEWLEQAKKRGWKLAMTMATHIYHYGGVTVKKTQDDGVYDVQAERKKSQALFRKRNKI